MRLALTPLVVALALACGGSGGADKIVTPPPPPPPPPAATNVTIQSATIQKGSAQDIVTTSLANSGGEGAYRLDFWGYPLNKVNAPMEVTATSDIVTVLASYQQSGNWTVPRRAGYASVARMIVYSRSVNSAEFRETGRVDFP